MNLGSLALRAEALRWHGAVPAGWAVRRFKQVAVVREGQVDPGDERYSGLPLFAPNHIESGTGRLLDVESASDQGAESGKYLVDAGDVLFSKIRPGLRKAALAPTNGLCSADMYPIKPGPQMDARFLYYSLLSEGFYRYSVLESARVAMPKINREALGECILLLPSLPQQRAVADFLDRKTAAIDALLERKERMLSLSEERRLATLGALVTKGVSPGNPLQDSGHPWLGALPAHWPVLRVRDVAKLESGHTPDKGNPDHWRDDNDIPWVSLNDTKVLAAKDYIDDTTLHINALGLQNSSARMLPARVVVFTRDATIGKAAITTKPMAVSQHIIAWVCGPRILPEYLLRVFYVMEKELVRYTMGATLRTIGMDDVNTLVTPVPPLDEQRDIVRRAEASAANHDALAESLRLQIGALHEYRRALVTAAVTGQLNVAAEEAA